MVPGAVQPTAPPVAAVPFVANTDVTQPRVWQDPNPVVNRQQVAPQAIAPQRQRAADVSENPGLRAPAVPMAKDVRERAIQRGEVPQTNVAPAPYVPLAPPGSVEPRAAPARAAPPATPPTPVGERTREQPRAAPAQDAPRPPREKDRAPVPPREQP